VELPATKALMSTRAKLLESFVGALTPVGLLDRFQVAGVIATWWDEIQFDFRALVAGGFGAVIDGWITTITTALEERNAKDHPLDHRFVRLLVPEYLSGLEAAEAKCAELDGRIKVATATPDEDDADEADLGDEALSPTDLNQLKKELRASKKAAKALGQDFVAELADARAALSADREQSLVLAVAHSGLGAQLDGYVLQHRQCVVTALENWWDKYSETLSAIEDVQERANSRADGFLRELGYA
jgi:type I restriction enzyme M protein